MYPKEIQNWINGSEVASRSGASFEKRNPATGEVLAAVSRSSAAEVADAVAAADAAFSAWSGANIITRADILRKAVQLTEARKAEIAEIIALESGRSKKDAIGEMGGVIECGYFFAGEGRRYYGEVLMSSQPNRAVEMRRVPVGVGALVTPFNNPAAGIAWKLFPALLCGNTIVLKSHEDVPYTGIWFAKILKEAGLPDGVVNVIQGTGPEAGAALVSDPRVKFVSFTGSVPTGRAILHATADRFAKVSIESGGKNPIVVCDDADLERAAALAVSSAFIDAGQRCAAGSRLIVFNAVYDQFKKIFLDKVSQLNVGTADADTYGAIISEKRMNQILASIESAKTRGTLLTGGARLSDESHRGGYFIAPTVFENISPDDELARTELFGPVAVMFRVKDFTEALSLANNAEYKLSSAIHTNSIHRAEAFKNGYCGGVVRVNGPTQGSEPHMPFGGMDLSGNGWREPGTKALDFYSEWKQISVDFDPSKL